MSNIKGRIAEICELESVASNPITDAITRKRVLNRIINLRLYILKNGKNQTACGHPTLKDGVCFGPHALTPGFMESRNSRIFVA